FVQSVGPDTTAPVVGAVSPADGATNVVPSVQITATFSESLDPATVTGSTFDLRDATNTLVPATVGYSNGTETATLTPLSPLAFSTSYTATLQGGPGGITDAAGNPLVSDYTWSFTSAGVPPPPPTSGPGGPIL